MGFSTDYTDVQSFELIPKGEYEVIIKAITERTTPNGATGLNLTPPTASPLCHLSAIIFFPIFSLSSSQSTLLHLLPNLTT